MIYGTFSPFFADVGLARPAQVAAVFTPPNFSLLFLLVKDYLVGLRGLVDRAHVDVEQPRRLDSRELWCT